MSFGKGWFQKDEAGTKAKASMGARYEVEVTVGSARDLKNVNWRNGELKPYVVLWVDDGPKSSTHVDLDDGENPDWDEKIVVPLPPSAGRLEDSVLHIDVVHANAAEGVKPLVGSARLPLRDVIDDAGVGGKVSRTLRLKRPSGRPQGKLDARVAVREAPPPRYHHDASPYPAPYSHPAGSGGGSRDPYYGAPPPPPYGQQPPPYAAPPVGYPAGAYSYGGAPQPAYGAPPSAPAYAAAPVVGAPAAAGAAQQKGNNNKMGMGTGLAVGAAAGVLGGLALAGGASYLGDHHHHDDDDEYDDY